jgi:hypothetical protein
MKVNICRNIVFACHALLIIHSATSHNKMEAVQNKTSLTLQSGVANVCSSCFKQSVTLHFLFVCSVQFSLQTAIISLNSVNRLIFVTVKCDVFSTVRTEFLNIIQTGFRFQGLTRSLNCAYGFLCFRFLYPSLRPSVISSATVLETAKYSGNLNGHFEAF